MKVPWRTVQEHEGELGLLKARSAAARSFDVVPAVFSKTEMADVSTALEQAPLDRTKAGARHVLGVPAFTRLANDARMLAIASTYLNASPVPFRATLFDKSPTSNWLVVWHQDTALPLRARVDDASWGPWSTKAGVLYAHAPAWALEAVVALRLSLDDSTVTNGPLRMLPGTHNLGVLSEDAIEALASSVTPVDCTVPAGGVVVMRPLTVHASSKAKDDRPRRVLHIEYAASLRIGPGAELATC
ncbi:MAG TPA: phytanoyl-CoA dioxygenase family protein [Vicinamibacterales bacterium]|nr:phytanoyl-CoA dioxygenase family protein [Vicinamibacterales bacterium]